MTVKSTYLLFLLIQILVTNSIFSKVNNHCPDSLQLVIRKTTIDTIRINSKLTLFDHFLENNEIELAENVLGKAILLCEKNLLAEDFSQEEINKTNELLILSNLKKSSLLRSLGDVNMSVELAKKCLKKSKEYGFVYGEAKSNFLLGEAYEYSGRLKKSLEYFYKAYELFKESVFIIDYAKTLNSLGHVYDYLGELDKALHYYTESLLVYEDAGHGIGVAMQYNNIGIIYYLQGDYETALKYYNESLEKLEHYNNIGRSYAYTLNNIGLIYDNLGDVYMAIDFYERSYKVFDEKVKLGAGVVLPLNNLGDSYKNQNDFDKAIEYYLISLDISTSMQDAQAEAYTLDKLCDIYLSLNDIESAELYCEQSLEKYEEIEDKHGLALSFIRMGDYYEKINEADNALNSFLKSILFFTEIGDKQGMSAANVKAGKIQYSLENLNDAYKLAGTAYKYAKELGHPADIRESSQLLYLIYRDRRNFENALYYYNEYVAMKDSIFNQDLRNAIQEQYYRRQYEKRSVADSVEFAQVLHIANLELEKKREETKRQLWVIYSILLGLAIVLSLLVVILKLYYSKKKAKDHLELSYAEINQKNEEILSQRDQLNFQHNQVLKQKTLLEKSHRRITDSINYAKLIQNALLPSESTLKSLIPDHIVFFKPSEIVSGDFYWIKHINDKIYIVVADCTGHGVPGAFMSMLGIAFLNEIARRDDVKNTSDILNILRQEVIDALSQGSEDSRPNEGMNVSIIAIDKKNMNAQFSGAYSSMCLIRHKDKEKPLNSSICKEKMSSLEKNDYVLYELKGDAQTVARTFSEDSFTACNFSLVRDDIIYLYSDGYIDQLNGITNRRYTTLRFKNLLIDIHGQSFSQKYSKLENTFNDWQGENDQTDDVLLIGIRI